MAWYRGYNDNQAVPFCSNCISYNKSSMLLSLSSIWSLFCLSDTFSIFDVDKETPLMNWRERFKQWNIKNPNWVYENLHSMQTTYYRAIKTLGSKS